MSFEEKVFMVVVFTVTIIVLSITAGVVYTSVRRSEAITEMVKTGTDPQSAACAVDGISESNKVVCTLIRNKETK